MRIDYVDDCYIALGSCYRDLYLGYSQSHSPTRSANFKFFPLQNEQYSSTIQSHLITNTVNYNIYFNKHMAMPNSKISQSSFILHRPLPALHSPLKKRQDNFILDCTSKQHATLQPYRAQDDAFQQPYLLTLLHKITTSNTKNKHTFNIRNIQQKPKKRKFKALDADSFRSFLQNRIEKMKLMKSSQNRETINNEGSLEKENYDQLIKQSQRQRFIQKKYSCYKIRSGVSSSKEKKKMPTFHVK